MRCPPPEAYTPKHLAERILTAKAAYFSLALENSVKSSEMSEIITHLAFYAAASESTRSS